jgi:hypothetical protein
MVGATAWRWCALLAFAMVAPVGLPAAAGDRRQPEVRRRQAGEPLLSIDPTLLQSSPDCNAPSLIQLQADQPMVVLGRWQSDDGQRWLRVRAAHQRGWLLI